MVPDDVSLILNTARSLKELSLETRYCDEQSLINWIVDLPHLATLKLQHDIFDVNNPENDDWYDPNFPLLLLQSIQKGMEKKGCTDDGIFLELDLELCETFNPMGQIINILNALCGICVRGFTVKMSTGYCSPKSIHDALKMYIQECERELYMNTDTAFIHTHFTVTTQSQEKQIMGIIPNADPFANLLIEIKDQ